MTSKYLYGAAAAALLLTACSQDEVVNMRQDGINYNVLAKNQTRAADSYCNILLPGHFNVWARTTGDNALYINGDEIVNDNGVWSDADGVRYWPQGKNLDFFAHVNGDGVFKYNDGAPVFENFKVKENVPEQLDLMYAVEKDAANSSAPVTINFRHALSQVCFRATNNTKNLQITINSVSVGHLTDGGKYTYPTSSTTENIEDPDHGDSNSSLQDGNRGSWALDDNYSNEYTASVNDGPRTLVAGDVNANLTCPEENHKNGFVNVMTLMPQQVAGWDPTKKADEYNGAYFLLDVVIENVVEGGENTVVYSGGTVVPVNVDWKEGYRYIYTFIFDEGGNGGFTPTPDDPQPVLTGIKYDVTVDDFIPVNGDGDGTGMETGYKYNGVVTLHSNYDTDEITKVTINSNEPSYSFAFAGYPLSREGYKLKGWADSKDATAADYDVDAKESLTLTENGNNSFEFYAVWEKNVIKNEVEIVFNNGDGTDKKEKAETSNGKGSISLPAGPADNEYRTFEGWILDGSNPEEVYQPGFDYEFTESNLPTFTAKIKYTRRVTLFSGEWTATYNGNQLQNGYLAFDKSSYEKGEETFTLPTIDEIVNTENATLKLKCWKYKGGNKIETPTIVVKGNVQLEAVWEGKGNIEGDGDPDNVPLGK